MENKPEINPPIELYRSLLSIQKELLGLAKDKSTSSYRYLTGDKLLGFIKPMMNREGLLLTQEIVEVNYQRTDYKTGVGTDKEKPKSEMLYGVHFLFTWIHVETGQTLALKWFSAGQNDWDKGPGSAMTYGERYFFMKMFHLATDEDDIDNPDRKDNEDEAPKAPKAQAKPQSPQQPSGNNSAPQAELKWLNEKEGGKDNPIYVAACDAVTKGYTEDQIKASLTKKGYKASKATLEKIMSFNKTQ